MLLLEDIENDILKDELEEKASIMTELDDFTKIAFDSLEPTQREILLEDSQSFLVYGKTGTGKTILAINRFLKLNNEGKNFILIIYTKALKSFLEGKFKKLQSEELSNYIYYEEELKRNIDNFSIEFLEKLDYIIIDEVQDFSFESIKKYMKSTNNKIFMFGDDGQQLYPDESNTQIIEEIKTLNIKSFELKKIYRLNKKIARLCEFIKEDKEGLVEFCTDENINDELPRIYEFSNIEKEVEFIKEQIEGESWQDVGIFLKKNKDVYEYYNYFRKAGLCCEYKCHEGNTLDFSTNLPKILTYHSAKGLEFERVFIPGCNLSYEERNTRVALFVACTRAKQTLIITSLKNELSPYVKKALSKISKKEYIYESR